MSNELRHILRGIVAVPLILAFGVIPAAAANAPSQLELVNRSVNSVTIGWRGVERATGYRLYRDGALVATAGADARRASFALPSYRPYTLGIGALKPSGEWLSTVTLRPRWGLEAVTQPSGPVREVSPGQALDTIVSGAMPGDTLRLRPGSYGRVTITRSFSEPLTIEGAPGVSVDGFTIRGGGGVRIQQLATTDENRVESGAHDVVFDGVSASVPATRGGASCWYLRGGVRAVTIQNSTGRGGWLVVKQYASPPQLARDIVVRDNRLSGAWEDIIHVDGADDMRIEHNVIQDPVETVAHNDGVHSQHSSRLRIVRNTFSWSSIAPTGGPNQAIMLGNEPSVWADRKVTDTYVANNLVHHWHGGRPLILNGTERTKIVNNSFVDSGKANVNDPSITISHQGAAGGQNPGLEIWNNILESVFMDRGAAPPAYFDRNLLRTPYKGVHGRNAIVADPVFVDRTSYRLARRSPARRAGLNRTGTPSLSLDGSRRSRPVDLGAQG